MVFSNLSGWAGSSCGASDKPAACGAADKPEESLLPAASAETASDFRPVRRERRGRSWRIFVARLRHNTGAERRSTGFRKGTPQQASDQGDK